MHTYRQLDRQTYRQTDKQIDRHTTDSGRQAPQAVPVHDTMGRSTSDRSSRHEVFERRQYDQQSLASKRGSTTQKKKEQKRTGLRYGSAMAYVRST